MGTKKKAVKNLHKRTFKPVLPLIAVIFILVLLWYKPGFMIAKAEEGLPLYNPLRTFNLLKFPFNDIGLGIAHAFHLPRLTFFGFGGMLQVLGFESGLIQAVLFFLIISTCLSAVYFLADELFPESGKKVGYAASLFYLFNLFSLSQVWGRFLYPLVFLWALLPIFTLFWIRWIKSGQYKNLIFLGVSSIFFSTSFGLTASIFAIWTPPFLYSLFDLKKHGLSKTFIRTLAGIAVWIIFSIWWIYPLIVLRDTTYSEIVSTKASYTSLLDVSVYFPSEEIVLLKQAYNFGKTSNWYNFYQNNIVNFLSYSVLAITAFGLFVSRNKKSWKFLAGVLIVGWFVSKGSNPPFGKEFFFFLYDNLPFTQVLRNPYEKFGNVFVLAYGIFFAIGLTAITDNFGKAKKTLTFASYLLFFGYLAYPFWNGSLYKGGYVKVPEYYAVTNEYIKEIGGVRILSLPFLKGAPVKTAWNYTGEEPSEYLFDIPVISKTFSLSQLDDFYLLLGNSLESENFAKLLAVSSVSHVVVHNDIAINPLHHTTSEETRQIIKDWENVSFKRNFGELSVYALDENLANERVYAVDEVLQSDSLEEAVSLTLSEDFSPKNEAVLVRSQNEKNIRVPNNLRIPSHTSTRINASFYKVEVEGATSPFILVLANHFDNHWIARIDGQLVESHFEINGFANAWIIEKGGNYTIELIYKVWPWD